MGRFAAAAAKFVGRTTDGGACGPKVKPGKPRRIRRKDGQGLNAPNSYGGNRHV